MLANKYSYFARLGKSSNSQKTKPALLSSFKKTTQTAREQFSQMEINQL